MAWLMISAAGSKNTHLDLQHHLQAASRAFHANKWILCDKGVSVLHRLRYFEKVISPVACFGASHRAIHKDDLAKLDVEYRRLLRMVVGPPADTNWASPWHEILHGWNNKVRVLSDYAGLKPWSVTCVEAVWKFASYVATLPSERWTRRILHWNIRGRRTRGRPAYTWETALERYCIWKGFDNWIVEAFEYGHWMRFKEDFVFFTLYTSWSGKILHFICLHPKGAAFGPASFDLTWLVYHSGMTRLLSQHGRFVCATTPWCESEGQARPPRQWRRRFTAHAPKKNVHNCYFLWPCGLDLHVGSSRAEPSRVESSRVESSRACTPKKWRAPLGTGVNKKWHVNKLEKIDTKV